MLRDGAANIAKQEKEKGMQRFYLGNASRGKLDMGLGLSLVAAVAKLHGGSLKLEGAHPGLAAQLIFQG